MEIDEFLTIVRRRRSVRKFKPDPIPDEYIEKVLEAGRADLRVCPRANTQVRPCMLKGIQDWT